MKKSMVVVYTDIYKSECRKSPRGYEEWHFMCKSPSGERFECKFNGMYKDVKQDAIEFACKHNSCNIYLLP